MPQNRPRIVWQTVPFDEEDFAVKIGKIIGGKWIWSVEFADGRHEPQTPDGPRSSFYSYEEALATGVRFAREQCIDKSRRRF